MQRLKHGKGLLALLVLAAVAILVATFSTTSALSKTVVGGSKAEYVFGGPKRDYLYGGGGNDDLRGGRGNDYMVGGKGKDAFWGGPGNDYIKSRDGKSEVVRCDSGRDRVTADRIDKVRNCERIDLPPLAGNQPTRGQPGGAAPSHLPTLGGQGRRNLFVGSSNDGTQAYADYNFYWQWAIPWLDYYWRQVMGNDRYAPLKSAGPIYDVISYCHSTPSLVNEWTMFYCAPQALSSGPFGQSSTPNSDYIGWSDAFLYNNYYLNHGAYPVVFTLAHEWGHAIEVRLGWYDYAVPEPYVELGNGTSPSYELTADCLGGTFIRYLWDNNALDPSAGSFNHLGHAIASLPNDGTNGYGTHGDTDHRIAAFNHGLQDGRADSCQAWLNWNYWPLPYD
jgi:hypothetical protein